MTLWQEAGYTFLAFATPFLVSALIFGAFRAWQVFRRNNDE